MQIKSFLSESLIEWPNKISSVIFLAGCNFRCPFCFVPYLVIPENIKFSLDLNEDAIIKRINNKKPWVNGIVITGGEPTIHNQLLQFIKKLKQQTNLPIRLNTNGSNPKMLHSLIQQNLIDSIALDIKSTQDKYHQATSSTINVKDIEESIKLASSLDDYEFRTTLVPGFHTIEDIKQITIWLLKTTGKNKLKAYYLQNFNTNADSYIDNTYKNQKPFSSQELENIKKAIKQHFDICDTR